jgi:hypothetical protein
LVNCQLTKQEEDDEHINEKSGIKERIVIRTTANGKSSKTNHRRNQQNNNNNQNNNTTNSKKRIDKQHQFSNSCWLDYANNDKYMRTCDDGKRPVQPSVFLK